MGGHAMRADPAELIDRQQQGCLHHFVDEQVRKNPDAVAILAHGRLPLTYNGLSRQVGQVVEALNDRGFGTNDRIAMVLPEGPEMAVAIIAISAGAVCAPLNPAYSPREFDFHVSDLNARALLILQGSESPATAIARARGIPVIELIPQPDAEAGLFTLAGEGLQNPVRYGFAQPDDTALAVHTSGTTARPKLVHLTHRNLSVSAQNICATLELTETDLCLNVMPMFHIHGLSALFASLAVGAGVICNSAFSAAKFFEGLKTFHPTWYSAAPTIHMAIVENAVIYPEIIADSGLRFIRSASAAMPQRAIADLERIFQAPFIEAYGMTEAAPQIASNRLPPCLRKAGSVGVAAGPDVAIMDEAGNMMPPGESGEVVIRGSNVVRAYENDPETSRKAFVCGWFRTGDRGYLDADGYLFIDGRLKELINRGGEKISPFEVDEVLMDHPAVAEAVTFAVPHPQLGENVAAAIVLKSSSPAFRSFHTKADRAEDLIREIRDFAATRLAYFKLPQQIVVVDEIPKGRAGKLQRLELAAALGMAASDGQQQSTQNNPVPPLSPAEQKMADIWACVLNIERPGIYDNFFALGGDSLTAAQVVARLRDECQVQLPMESLFMRPTVAGLVDLVARYMDGFVLNGQAMQELQSPQRTAAISCAAAIHRQCSAGPFPLSFAQQGLWFLDRIDSGNAAYNMSASLRITGTLCELTLQRSLNEILRRHDTLRTTFHLSGEQPVQIISPAEQTRLFVVDLTALSSAEREIELKRLSTEEAGCPFDLTCGPLFRASLVRLGADEHALLITMHHIISDGWSTGVLHRELTTLYRAFLAGHESPLPELPVQYVDFVVYQREMLRAEALKAQLVYWKKQLRNIPPSLNLPFERPRPAFKSYQGARLHVAISREVTEGLKALSNNEESTLFMTLLASLQLLLYRYTGQDDIPVGVPIANRTRLETEGLIGFFANTLVLRTELSGDPLFRELLGRVRRVALEAYAHQDLPFEKLVEELQPQRDPSHVPLFQVMFAFQNLPDRGMNPRLGTYAKEEDECMTGALIELAAGLTARPFSVDSGTAKFDLTLYLSESEQGLTGAWQYNTDLFDAATIERIARHFQSLLEGIAANPELRLSEFPLLSDSEQRQLEVDWNRTEAPFQSARCFHHLFEEQVERTPDAIAVESGEDQLTYRELNSRANQVAWRLKELGVSPETLVGISLTRSVEFAATLLGVWKAGGACLPIDPEYPPGRQALMLNDAQVSVLVTVQRLHSTLTKQSGYTAPLLICMDTDQPVIAGKSRQNPECGATTANLAYVIYTSGSTGYPKGVMITHDNLCHYAQAMQKELGLTVYDRYLHTASFAFSSSVRQFAVPLSCGAAVVVASTDQIRDPLLLLDLVRDRRVSILDMVPSYWQSCIRMARCMEPSLRSDLSMSKLRLILSASEPLSADLTREWTDCFGSGAELINMFGLTETTGIVTIYKIPVSGAETAGFVPGGRPVANTRVYLLDASRRPVPIGVCGELYIGGAGVGRGYLNLRGLTEKQFVPDPFSATAGARLFRTGDMARYRPDGNIEFIGRLDAQIKIRGFRIEPGEIEAVLREHAQVQEAAVVAYREAIGSDTSAAASGVVPILDSSQRLAAFVVLREREQLSGFSGVPGGTYQIPEHVTMDIRGYLKRKLPEYMTLSKIVALDTLPLTPNGKLDRLALSAIPLQEPQSRRQESARSFIAPRTPSEKTLSAVWMQVLGLDRVGIEDNFFDLGGDSILSIQIVLEANKAGLQISLRQLFQYQTLAELARVAGISQDRLPQPTTATVIDAPEELAAAGDVEPVVRVTVDSLRAYGCEALERAGLSAEGAAIVTEVQLESSLRGQPTHNMGDIPRYARRLTSGIINPGPRIRIERETAISASLDGDNGPGQWVAVVAMETAIQKAREKGVGMVGVRRSNHFGAAGHYAGLAAKQGLIGLCTTNGPLILAPTGGVTPTFGNNPLGVGIPAGISCPIILDIAMSVAPRGKIGVQLAAGRPLPPGWILDGFGRPSMDLADLAAGLGVPIGGHKGYGLALVMEVLAGALTGAGFCRDHSRKQIQQSADGPDFGHFFMVIDPEIFMPLAEFTERVDRMIGQTKAGERAADVDEILIPGEAEFRARQQNIREGVPLRPLAYRALLKYGEKAGLNTRLEKNS